MNAHRRAVLTALLLIGASGLVVGTGASYNAQTGNGSGINADALLPPSNFVSTPTGNSVVHTFTPNGFAGQTAAFSTRVYEMTPVIESGTLDGQTPPTCDVASITTLVGTTTDGSVTSITDASPGGNGLWTCYRVENRFPAGTGTVTWLSPNNPTPVATQIGHVVRSITFANNGTAGSINQNDTITIDFNQPVDTALANNVPVSTSGAGTPAAGTHSICVRANGGNAASRNKLYIGRTATGACSNSDAPSTSTPVVGYLTFTNQVATDASYHATYSWPAANCSGTACSKLVITVGARYNGASDPVVTMTAGTTLFLPTAVVTYLRSALGGNIAICTSTNTTARTCQPAIIGSL